MPGSAHSDFTILFIDIVQYSIRRNSEQRQVVLQLTQALRDSFIGTVIADPRKGLFLATGDGLALALAGREFNEHPEQVVDCAVDISRRLAQSAKLRIGLHRGIGYLYPDFNAQFLRPDVHHNGHNNIAGASINFAQRVMSLGDPDDILATDLFFRHFQENAGAEAARRFVEVGDVEVKHGTPLKVFKLVATPAAGLVTPKRILDYISAKQEVINALNGIHTATLNTVFGSARRDLAARVTLLLFDDNSQSLSVTNFRTGSGVNPFSPPCQMKFLLSEGPGRSFALARDKGLGSTYWELVAPPPEGDPHAYLADVQRHLGIPEEKAELFHRPSRCYLYIPISVGSNRRRPIGVVSVDAMRPLFTAKKKRTDIGRKKFVEGRLQTFNQRIEEHRQRLANAWTTLSHY
jgi:class 3 adenylate cyclase